MTTSIIGVLALLWWTVLSLRQRVDELERLVQAEAANAARQVRQ